MKIKIKKNNQWYRDLEGREFDVIEILDSIHDGIYFIKNKENNKQANWFRKCDCEMLDKEYLNSITVLNLNNKLRYWKDRLQETKENIALYEHGDYKEKFKGEKNILLIGSLGNLHKIQGKIEMLEDLLGVSSPFE